MAFKGRPNTVLVGTPTAGLTTGVVPHKLSDGLRLISGTQRLPLSQKCGRRNGVRCFAKFNLALST